MRADKINELNKITTQGNINESVYGVFWECLRYKLAQQEKLFLIVDRCFPSTRTCSACGCVMPEEISTKRRTWICPHCGAVLMREANAAMSIKTQVLVQYFRMQEQRESA